MNIGIYGRAIPDHFLGNITKILNTLLRGDAKVKIYRPFHLYLSNKSPIVKSIKTFTEDELKGIDVLISIGGDGTILELMTMVKDAGIPILGINSGRLGFMANINANDIPEALQKLLSGNYEIEKRGVLTMDTKSGLFGDNNFALNEVTVSKKDTSSMITIHTYLDDEFLGSFWSDGLIVSSPSGSTAYSMSCGGPILMPGCNTFVITPIAPHNLNMRPIVIPDNKVIKLQVEGRSNTHLISLDSRNLANKNQHEITIKKADFQANLIIIEGDTYCETLRNKLFWGMDKRTQA